MLAERKLPDTSTLEYPIYASPKLDGIRALVVGAALRSRVLKPIPNRFVSARFSSSEFNGLDGELILGSPHAPDVYRTTQKAVSRHEGQPDAKFYVFDDFTRPALRYADRYFDLREKVQKWGLEHVVLVPTCRVLKETELLIYEEVTLNAGYEGLILRSPDGPYKFGRSTMKEGWMLKLKRFQDAEAKVLGYFEEMHNGNEATTNALGRTERSSHKAGLSGKGTLGKLVCVDEANFPGVQFEVGTGFDAAERQSLWKTRRTGLVGRVLKYKYFAHGVKDRPRHPVFLGWREKWDQ